MTRVRTALTLLVGGALAVGLLVAAFVAAQCMPEPWAALASIIPAYVGGFVACWTFDVIFPKGDAS